ncbi:MAG TPA: relaxase/mobilization nuclease domain-containing protein [Candidatus Babeliaceae bacterium]|nr:relaxase/mobilization nuclease domain-containing protein [Candidatus Babeliaceae bacterium]
MVARITIPNSIQRALNYNEQKVKEGAAECILAHNFLKAAGNLNFHEKLQRFEQLIALNERAKTNAIHISLNFDVSENLPTEKLAEIATVYMQKIGFGSQPFLAYKHLDAGHPHIHIVSTNIKADGRRISVHNIGRNQSTVARKEIEIAYGLVKAEDYKQQNKQLITPLNAQKVTYGKSQTKRGITNVLDAVLNQYRYASLPELNAVLKLYNVVADRGQEGGFIFNKKGLVYRVLDEQGNKVGVPIKASDIYSKPTLAFLLKKFIANAPLKQPYKKRLKTAIDWALLRPRSLHQLEDALAKENIRLVKRQNEQGIIYGLTYIDLQTKCVFNGSDIGKEYSAKAILEKCGHTQIITAPKPTLKEQPKKMLLPLHINAKLPSIFGNAANILLTPTEQNGGIPYELRKKKKKRKINH